jgi:hypothetical protein
MDHIFTHHISIICGTCSPKIAVLSPDQLMEGVRALSLSRRRRSWGAKGEKLGVCSADVRVRGGQGSEIEAAGGRGGLEAMCHRRRELRRF